MIDLDSPTAAGAEDIYHSRGGSSPRLVKRRDPVVYGSTSLSPPIDPSLIKSYEEKGYVVLDKVFSETEITLFQNELERLRSSEDLCRSELSITEPQSNDIRSIFKVHRLSPLFSKLASDPRLADLARYLLCDEVYIHQSRLNYKPGFRGREFYWHSDFETWHIEDGMPRMRALSISVTLTENYEHNGPLMVIPGSHNAYVVCEGQTPENHYQSSLKKQEYGIPNDRSLDALVGAGEIVSVTGKPGSVIVFDCNLMHGSNGNITPYPRSNAFFVYNAVSNRVVEPFSGQRPRPEHICSRDEIEVIYPSPLEVQHE